MAGVYSERAIVVDDKPSSESTDVSGTQTGNDSGTQGLGIPWLLLVVGLLLGAGALVGGKKATSDDSVSVGIEGSDDVSNGKLASLANAEEHYRRFRRRNVPSKMTLSSHKYSQMQPQVDETYSQANRTLQGDKEQQRQDEGTLGKDQAALAKYKDQMERDTQKEKQNQQDWSQKFNVNIEKPWERPDPYKEEEEQYTKRNSGNTKRKRKNTNGNRKNTKRRPRNSRIKEAQPLKSSVGWRRDTETRGRVEPVGTRFGRKRVTWRRNGTRRVRKPTRIWPKPRV